MKHYLLIHKSLPYEGLQAQESLELALALAALGEKVSLYFTDNGVLQLNTHTSASTIFRKEFTDALKALEFYDINNVYIDLQSIKQHNSNPNDFIKNLAVKASNIQFIDTTKDIDLANFSQLIESADIILNLG